MHSLTFLEIDKRLWIPENLGECDRRQYLDMAKLALMLQLEEITFEQFRVLGLYALLNMEHNASTLENASDEKWLNIFKCSELLDSFFTTDEHGKKHLVQDYITNPVKVVHYKFHSFYGPKDAFVGMTYGQFEDGFGELHNFNRTREVESLVKLFAIFYLKNNENYSSLKIDKRIAFFDTLDVRYIFGFYLLFTSFVNFLTTNCVVLLDGKEVDLTILFGARPQEDSGEETADSEEGLGLRSTSFQLAESGVFGTLKEMREENALIVFVRMQELVLRYRKEKEEAERQEQDAKNKSQNHD